MESNMITTEEPIKNRWEFLPSLILYRDGHWIVGSLLLLAVLVNIIVSIVLQEIAPTLIAAFGFWVISVILGAELRKKRWSDQRARARAEPRK